jgi:DNA-binding GntR family transcriptional regulator
MQAAATAGDSDAVVEANWSFHRAFCALPGHGRLLGAYDSLTLQLRLCMSLNLNFRRQHYDDPQETVRRHAVLLELIKAGKRRDLLKEMAVHGDRAFLTKLSQFLEDGGIADAAHAKKA